MRCCLDLGGGVDGIWAMVAFALRKSLLLLALFLTASALLFTASRLTLGDGVLLAQKAPDPERAAQIEAELGLDLPWPAQYVNYLGNFLQGEWGASILNQRSVADEVKNRLPATLELSLTALALGVVIGVGTTLLAELAPWQWARRLPEALGALGLTVPIFWLGLLFIIVGAAWLNWFPVSGRFDYILERPEGTGFLVIDSLAAGDWEALGSTLHHLALPALCLSFFPAAMVSGLLRARIQEPRWQRLLVALRAKGLSPTAIWLRHGLRLLGAPLIIVLGTSFGLLLGGSVLTETVFAWPGMGRYLVGAVLDRDVFIIQYALLLVMFLIFAVVWLTELLAVALNPRLAQPGEGDDAH
ncbi:ABC transporter permease [Cerasicoccus frondis]|uniref:ABC transporter permease n=1 Tax=Cerasicoccus frondis TaxID=490090 RepID=UPI00285252DF|nr:ABC transporter permease [Cerasicoccus frondis]